MLISIILVIAVITLLVSANALYVAAEFATVSSRKTRINQMAGEGHRLARILRPIVENTTLLDDYIAACQVGITVSSLALGAYGQNAITPLLGKLGHLAEAAAYSIAATTVLICLTILQVVLGELFPKSIALLYPERMALMVTIPMQWSLVILRPFIWLLNGSGNLILKVMGIKQHGPHHHVHSPGEIELLVGESYQGGLLDEGEQQMLRNAFRLRELLARQVMVPRTRLTAAPVDSSVDDLLERACQAGLSRIPLYQTRIDDLVGFVHVKDLFRLRLAGQQHPQEVVREVVYVPETLPVADVWATLNEQRQYMAIVLDEYGGTAGLITFEDLIEEIFGELQDEFDDELPLISAEAGGRIHLRADLLVTDVNEYLGLALPDDEADTLGGLVFSALGRLPVVGDEAAIGTSGIKIRVEAIDTRSITEVSLQLRPGAQPHINEWEVGSDE
ncbi:MAG: HlyC/CorC family transporter [Anaerolineae bacterium]|nr:HlyC/CorC family transporter [Anaerolineae bacterium]